MKLKTIDIDSALKFFGEELKRRLKDRLVKIILFGSYAKGLADVDSDVDVLIIHSHPDPDKELEIMVDAALRTTLKHDIPLEPIAMTLHEYNKKSLFTIEVGRTDEVIYSIDSTTEDQRTSKKTGRIT